MTDKQALALQEWREHYDRAGWKVTVVDRPPIVAASAYAGSRAFRAVEIDADGHIETRMMA